jgi:Immunity protein Imm1
MTTTLTPLTLAWGSIPDSDDQFEATVATSTELATVLARIHAEAMARGLAQQVDAWLAESDISDDDLPDPFIQFVVGDPHRASLRWLGTDTSFQAVDPHLPPLPEPITYDNGGAADPMDPAATRITFSTVQRILDSYLHHRTRPQDIAWITI